MLHRLLPAVLLAAAAPVFVFAQSDWNDPFPPHRIATNLYYVGSKGLSSYLVTTKEGHILINASFDRTVPLIRASVEKLGFKFTDVKILLGNHAHGDHVEGTALIKEYSGAKVYVMQGDDKVVESGGKGQYLYKESWKPVKVDKVMKDGEKITLGEMTVVAHLTPGHTRGNTSYTIKVEDRGKTYNALIIGSPNINPGYQLVNNADYPTIAADYAKTFRVLKSLPCDIFLGAHGLYYNMIEKYNRMAKDPSTNLFIDPAGCRAYITEREENYRKVLAEQQKR